MEIPEDNGYHQFDTTIAYYLTNITSLSPL